MLSVKTSKKWTVSEMKTKCESGIQKQHRQLSKLIEASKMTRKIFIERCEVGVDYTIWAEKSEIIVKLFKCGKCSKKDYGATCISYEAIHDLKEYLAERSNAKKGYLFANLTTEKGTQKIEVRSINVDHLLNLYFCKS
jgi:hypothetical protein